MDGFTIATQPPRAPQRPRSSPPRKPGVRPRSKVPPFRPNYWLVAGGVIVVALLAMAFLVTILILWSLTGALTTAVMVLAYSTAMFVLWRVGVSRL